MRKRSKTYLKHQSRLKAKENNLRQDIEGYSTRLESIVKRVLIISLVGGISFLFLRKFFQLFKRQFFTPKPQRATTGKEKMLKLVGFGTTLVRTLMLLKNRKRLL